MTNPSDRQPRITAAWLFIGVPGLALLYALMKMYIEVTG